MGRLDVKVVAARNCPKDNDLYLKLTLGNQNHRTSTYEPSSDDSTTAIWKEVFKFVVSDHHSQQLAIELWDEDAFDDDLVCNYTISLGGLVRGRVHDKWYLMQNQKGCCEVRIRMIARDFGADPPPGPASDDEPEPENYGPRNPPGVPGQGKANRRGQQLSPQQMQMMQQRQQQQQQMYMQQQQQMTQVPGGGYGRQQMAPGQRQQMLMQQLNAIQMDQGTKQQLMRSFQMFDADGSQCLDREESFAAMLSFLPQASPMELNQLIMSADTDGDGKLTIVEYARLAAPYLAGAAANSAVYRDRLVRFYQVYAPEKLSNVDSTLQSFAGKEEMMFQKLVQKYGPEPPAGGQPQQQQQGRGGMMGGMMNAAGGMMNQAASMMGGMAAQMMSPNEGDMFALVPMHNQSVVIDANSGAHDGAHVHAMSANGSPSQKWMYHKRPNGTVSFHPQHAPHTALDGTGVSAKHVYIWGARDNFVNQSFTLEAVPGQSGVFWIKWNSWYLDVDLGTGGGHGSKVHLWENKTGAPNQQFRLQKM